MIAPAKPSSGSAAVFSRTPAEPVSFHRPIIPSFQTDTPAPAHELGDASVAIRAEIEFVRIAYGDLLNGTVASTGAAIAFAVAVNIEHPSQTLWTWLAVMVGFAGYRLLLARGYANTGPTAEAAAYWGKRYAVATTLTGLGWGASTWIFPLLAPQSALGVIHVLLLAGLVTGSARTLLPLRCGSIAYLIVVLLPLAARFLANANFVGVTAGVAVVLFAWYLISATLQSHETLTTALTMGFEREAMARKLESENKIREAREAELSEARERAESANRAKGEFLATISHEIRTPMNGVLGMLRVVRETPLSEDQCNYLKTASDSAESLLLLLNDVLDFSKIEAGRLEIESGPFPPAKIASAVTDLLLTRARDKGLQFDLILNENLPGVVISDASRVRQILVNLIGNAIKFTERGRIELNVSCAERNGSRAVLHFTVTDTGIGINSNALGRLFKPFTQAEASMTRKYGGTGLGLAISMRLAQAMGGALQVQSTANRGSVFRLILPCKLPGESDVHNFESRPPFLAPTLCGRVLVVEDDSVNQQVIDLFLKKLHITPKFAPDGEVAVATALDQPFDLVLMDCQLPGIDGLEATRRIRQKLDGKPLKIIALTANVSTQVRTACLTAGMDDFLTKPIRFELLANILQRHLPQR